MSEVALVMNIKVLSLLRIPTEYLQILRSVGNTLGGASVVEKARLQKAHCYE